MTVLEALQPVRIQIVNVFPDSRTCSAMIVRSQDFKVPSYFPDDYMGLCGEVGRVHWQGLEAGETISTVQSVQRHFGE